MSVLIRYRISYHCVSLNVPADYPQSPPLPHSCRLSRLLALQTRFPPAQPFCCIYKNNNNKRKLTNSCIIQKRSPLERAP